jgi:hypothetical protein
MAENEKDESVKDEKKKDENPSKGDGLVSIEKNGEKLRVNPVALQQHIDLGWKTV